MATNLEFIKSASGSSVSLLDVSDCFSADFDVYYFALTKLKRASASNFIYIRFLDSSGTVIDQAEYDYASQEIRPYTSFLKLMEQVKHSYQKLLMAHLILKIWVV